MSEEVDKGRLERDIKRAVKWAAAEHKYIVDLKEDIMQISRENAAGTKEKDARKAVRALRYVSLAERRAFRFEQRVEGELENIYASLSGELDFEFDSLQKIREGIETSLREMKVEDRELVKYASMYEGLLRHGLTQAEAEIQLLEEVETEYPKRAEKITTELQVVLTKVLDEVKGIDKWVSALIVSLEKAEHLVKDIKPGLMGVNSFVEKLIEEIVDNKLVQTVSQAQRLRSQVEKFALDKDYSNPLLLVAQKELSDNPDGKALEELLAFNSKIVRIQRILTKMKASKRYAHLKPQIVPLQKLFGILFGPTIREVRDNIEKQSVALEKNDFYAFLVLFQQQKGELAPIAALLEKMGLEVYLDQVVRSGFQEKHVRTFAQEIRTTHKQLGTLLTSLFVAVFVLAVVTVPLWGPPVLVARHLSKSEPVDTGNIYSGDSAKIKQYIRGLEKAKLEYCPRTVEDARKLHGKYSVKTLGPYTFEHLGALSNILHRFKPAEVERFLSAVVFIEGKPKDLDADYAGLYLPSKKAVRVFLTSRWKEVLEHEIAHARSFGLPKSWYAKWRAVNEDGIIYPVAQKFAIKKERRPGGKEDFSYWAFDEFDYGPALGYAEPYGVTNIEEDIATFTELVELNNPAMPAFTNDAIFLILPFLEVYEQKARLLLKFGFIRRNVLRLFLKRLGRYKIRAQMKVARVEERAISFIERNSLTDEIAGPIRKYLETLEEDYLSHLGWNFKRKWIRAASKGLSYAQARKRVESETLYDWSKEDVRGIFHYRAFLNWLRYGYIVPNGTTGWKEDVKMFVQFADEMTHSRRIEIGWTSTVLLLPYLGSYKEKFKLLGRYGLISNAKSLMDQMDSLEEYFQKRVKPSWRDLKTFEKGGWHKRELSVLDKEDLKRAQKWFDANMPEEEA